MNPERHVQQGNDDCQLDAARDSKVSAAERMRAVECLTGVLERLHAESFVEIRSIRRVEQPYPGVGVWSTGSSGPSNGNEGHVLELPRFGGR